MPTTPPPRGAKLGYYLLARSAPLLAMEITPSGPPSEWPCPGRSTASSGRPSAKRHRVPGVCILRAAVHQDDLGRLGAPDQARDLPAGRHLDLDPPDRRWAGIGQPVLLGVLVEEPELVIGHHAPHSTAMPPRGAPLGLRMAPMRERRLSAVVLAAGEGTRMRSERPKPLHLLCGREMILHVLDAMAELDVTRVVVMAHLADWVARETFVQHAPAVHADRVRRVETQSGTGDALAVGTGLPDDDDEEETSWSCCRVTPRCCGPRPWPPWCGLTGAAMPFLLLGRGGESPLVRAWCTAGTAGVSGGGGRCHRGGAVISEVNTSIYCSSERSPGAGAAPGQPGQPRLGEYFLDRRRERALPPGAGMQSLVLPDPWRRPGSTTDGRGGPKLRDRINERWMRRA